VLRWGTTAAVRNEATLLYSSLDDGRYIVTSDRVAGTRAPELFDDLVILGVQFDELVVRHEIRVRATGQRVRRFDPANPLAEFHAIQERRAQFLVDRGEAYFTDPEETAIRSTFKGALKLYSQSFSVQHVERTPSVPGTARGA
jgi:hypothetical protein